MQRSWQQPTAGVMVALTVWLAAGDWRPARSATEKGPASGQPDSRAAALCARGLELGYQLDHTEALTVFKEAIAAEPANPRSYRLAAGAAWAALLFRQGAITVDDYLGEARSSVERTAPNAELDATVQAMLRQAISLAEAGLRASPDEADAHYQAGAAYGFLATYTATVQGRMLASFGPARRAYREHALTLSLDPGRRDAGLIPGLYQYAVSAMSAPARLVARFAGFGSGRDAGLRQVEEAARYPSDAQPNAMFTLILLYTREHRFDDALRTIGQLQARFPRNRLLWLEAGSTALRAGRPAEARAFIERGLARLAEDPRPRAPGEDARWRLAHGAALVACGEPAAAEPELRVALGGAARDWVRGRIHKELGRAAELSGNRGLAHEEYQRASGLCRADRDEECLADLKTRLRKGGRP